ncbi:hypothetical protein B0H12DRAFT_1154920 [Mycena haematopus]|nr:hypothetical protein B0H12DRAFT_1154920 [Mycena haematopus]
MAKHGKRSGNRSKCHEPSWVYTITVNLKGFEILFTWIEASVDAYSFQGRTAPLCDLIPRYPAKLFAPDWTDRNGAKHRSQPPRMSATSVFVKTRSSCN